MQTMKASRFDEQQAATPSLRAQATMHIPPELDAAVGVRLAPYRKPSLRRLGQLRSVTGSFNFGDEGGG